MKKSRFLSLILSSVLALSSIPFTAARVSAAGEAANVIEGGDRVVLTDGTSTAGFTAETMTLTVASDPKYYYLETSGQLQSFSIIDFPSEIATNNTTAKMTFAVKRSAPDGDDVVNVRFGANNVTTPFAIGDLYTEHTMQKTSLGTKAIIFGSMKASTGNKPIDLLGVKISDGDNVYVAEGVYNNGVWSDNWTVNTNNKQDYVRSEPAYVAVGDAQTNLKRLYYTFGEAITLEPGSYKISADVRPRVYTMEKDGVPKTRAFRIALYKDTGTSAPVAATGLSNSGATGALTPANGALNWSTISQTIEVTETQTLKRIDLFGGTTNGLDNTAYDLRSFAIERIPSPEAEVEGNLIVDGTCNDGIPEGMTDSNNHTLTYGAGYVLVEAHSSGVEHVKYIPTLEKPIDPSHAYELSFRIRCNDKNESCNVRLYNSDGKSTVTPESGYISDTKKHVIPVDGDWKTVKIRISANTNTGMFLDDGIGIRIHGYNAVADEVAAGTPAGFYELRLDSFVLIDLTETYGVGAYDNLIEDGDCNDGIPAGMTDTYNHVLTKGDGYVLVEAHNSGVEHVKYVPVLNKSIDPSHSYVFSFRIRCNDETESCNVRLYNSDGKSAVNPISGYVSDTKKHVIPVDGQWKTVNIRISADTNAGMFLNDGIGIRISGYNAVANEVAAGTPAGFYKLRLDDFKLIDLTLVENPDNLILNGGFSNDDPEKNLAGWVDEYPGKEPVWEIVDGSGVVEISERDTGDQGVQFTSAVKVYSHKRYELSFRIRTKEKDDTSVLRLYTEANGSKTNPIVPTCNEGLDANENCVEINSEWQTFTFEINTFTNSIFTQEDKINIRITGADSLVAGHGTYYIDDIVLIELEDEETGRPDQGVVMMLLFKKRQQSTGGNTGTANKDFVRTNLIEDAISREALPNWKIYKQKLELKSEDGKNYLAASDITINYQGFTYNPGLTLPAGSYEFSCKLRTSVPGEKTVLRIANSSGGVEQILDVDNKWQKASYQFTVTTPMVFSVKIVGGTKAEYIQSYDISDMMLIDLNEKAPKNNEKEVASVDYLGNAVSEEGLKLWNAKKQKLEYISTKDGGYLSMSGIVTSTNGFDYVPESPIPAGKYKLTGAFRTTNPGELTHIRLNFRDADGNVLHKINVYPTSGEWLKVEAYVTLSAPAVRLWINGGPSALYVQPYEVAELCLVPVSKILNNEISFGKAITPEQLAK